GQGFQPRLGDPERVALRRFCNALFLAGVCGLTMWWRPLHAQPRDVRLVDAVKRRDDKAFAALLRAKADVNAKQPDGATALVWAAAEGHSDVVAGLVEMGATVDAASRSGFTPLVFATIKDDVASIKTLLGAGANPNIALLSGTKPIIVAMQYRHTAAALALLEGGADITVRDRAGNTTLHLAAPRSEEHTSELQSRGQLVCRRLLEKKKRNRKKQLT